MRKVLIQFHMLPNETIYLLEECFKSGLLNVKDIGTVTDFYVNDYDRDLLIARSSKVKSFLIVSENEVDVNFNNQVDFMRKNNGSLFVEIGHKQESVLNESSISGIISRKHKNILGLISLFKKKMKKGCYSINMETGDTVKIPTHYYSIHASIFEQDGGTLAPIAGNTVFSVTGNYTSKK